MISRNHNPSILLSGWRGHQNNNERACFSPKKTTSGSGPGGWVTEDLWGDVSERFYTSWKTRRQVYLVLVCRHTLLVFYAVLPCCMSSFSWTAQYSSGHDIPTTIPSLAIYIKISVKTQISFNILYYRYSISHWFFSNIVYFIYIA